jgi:GT2 family glycosyltransferase/spore maturation protein CgeB
LNDVKKAAPVALVTTASSSSATSGRRPANRTGSPSDLLDVSETPGIASPSTVAKRGRRSHSEPTSDIKRGFPEAPLTAVHPSGAAKRRGRAGLTGRHSGGESNPPALDRASAKESESAPAMIDGIQRGDGGADKLPVPQRSEFDEAAYLRVHTDVLEALGQGVVKSGFHHFVDCGQKEGRWWRRMGRDTELADQGFLQHVGSDGVFGWASRVSGYKDTLNVEILLDGTVIAVVQANEFREDLLAAGIGTGCHGFVWQPPPSIDPADLTPARVACRSEGADSFLPLTANLVGPQVITSSESEPGDFGKNKESPDPNLLPSPQPATELAAASAERYQCDWSCDCSEVTGWIIDTAEQEPVVVHIAVDDELVWRGVARRLVTVTTEKGIGLKGAGFRALLPLPSSPVATRSVSVTLKDGTHLPGSPRSVAHGSQFLGYLERMTVNPDEIVLWGWCIDRVSPSAQVQLHVLAGGRKLSFAATYSSRADLTATGFDAPYAVFNLVIPCKTEEIDLATLTVLPYSSMQPICRHETFSVDDCRGSQDHPEDKRTLCQADDVIQGTIDEITPRFVRGWARNMTNPEALVVLDCFINGKIYATTAARRFRSDLAKHFNDHGCHEYLFELTPAASEQYPGTILVESRLGVGTINHKHRALKVALPPSRVIQARSNQPLDSMRHKSIANTPVPNGISIIVINRNGAALLETMFSSFAKYETFPDYEFLIVDHCSSDRSRIVVDHWANDLVVTWVQRDGNFSFSSSNNLAARLAKYPLVVFLNNDITFVGCVLASIAAHFADLRVGCVGIRLDDDGVLPRIDKLSAIQHLGVHWSPGSGGSPFQPFESRDSDAWKGLTEVAVQVPAVTGAFMACRRDEFLDLNGFNEQYFYGFEDIDLCLKYQHSGRLIVADNSLSALHLRGFSRMRMDRQFDHARSRNKALLEERWGFWLRRRIAESKFKIPGFWASTPVRIAFVVSEATEVTLAGDYFTALELASQLSAQFSCTCAFLEKKAGNEYELATFDVVIAMLDDFEPRNIRNASPHLIKIAWVRNWFERFAGRDSATRFDAVWASSELARTYLAERLSKPVALMPIAGSEYRFQAGKPDDDLASDYCFTGSYWGLNREILQMLDPKALPFRFSLFGTGWEGVASLAPYARGPIPYKKIANVYASTRLVIDDANHVTKQWGAVNSRVFDAILAGALVVTNGRKGAQDLFKGELPTYSTPQELEDLLWHYLTDEDARVKKVHRLKQMVLKNHTYRIRARAAWAKLSELGQTQWRFAIKIGAPSQKVQNEWGDYHFAIGIKRALEMAGHTVRVDCLDAWNCPAATGDDVVIVLRGLSIYAPKSHQINLMWNISHPDRISPAEYNSYDHVFVASDLLAWDLQRMLKVPVSALLQCTDPELFNLNVQVLQNASQVLFVGNSRNEFRPIVADAFNSGLPLEVYGSRWESFLPSATIKGQYVPNNTLASHYRSAGVLLNDHWADMRQSGFISNRLFDAVACGARIVSDEVPGMQTLFRGVVRTYQCAEDLPRAVQSFAAETAEEVEARRNMAQVVASEHSFTQRVHTILLVAKGLRQRKEDVAQSCL